MAGAEVATRPSLLAPRRLLLIVVLLAAVAIAFFAVQNLAPSTIYYLTPTEASWTLFNKGQYLTVTPFVEIPLTSHHGTVFGMGLGWTF